MNYLAFIFLLFSIRENFFFWIQHIMVIRSYSFIRVLTAIHAKLFLLILIYLSVSLFLIQNMYVSIGIFQYIFCLSARYITHSGSCRIILQSLCSEWPILPIALDYGNGWPYQQVKRLWRWWRGLWHTAWYHKETWGPLLLYLNLISLPLRIDLLLSVWPEDFLTVLCRNLPALTCLHNDNVCN